MKRRNISNDELLKRQLLVSLFTGFFLCSYAVIINILRINCNVIFSLINFVIWAIALFLSKFIVEKIFKTKFKDYIVG